MILDSTFSLYKAFLDGINKSGNFSIDIDAFNRIINDWGQDEWVNDNVIKPELDQLLMDRLSILKVVTDDEFAYTEKINGADKYILKAIPANSKWTTTPHPLPDIEKYFMYPLNGATTINTVKYPAYLRLLNVSFKVKYLAGNECNKEGISDWLQADVLRSDNEIANKDNPFRKTREDVMYYELIGDSIKLVHDEYREGESMRLKYFRYPRKIFLNEESTLPDDEQTEVPDYTGSTNGSINCEFSGQLRKEILDTAIRIFLERVQDVRYKSYLNELNIRNNG